MPPFLLHSMQQLKIHIAGKLTQRIDQLASTLASSQEEPNTAFPYPRGTDVEPKLFTTVDASDANLVVSNDGRWLVHYSGLCFEDYLTIFALNDHITTQTIANSNPNHDPRVHDGPYDVIKSVAFSDDSTRLLAVSPYNINLFEYKPGQWVCTRRVRLRPMHMCCQAVFVQGSNESIITIIHPPENEQQVHSAKITMDEQPTSEPYRIETVMLHFPGEPPLRKAVVDRGGRPGASACYELLSTEKMDSVFSRDCSLIATMHAEAVHLLRRGSTRRRTGEFPYTVQFKLDVLPSAYPGDEMCFNPNGDVFCINVGSEVRTFDILDGVHRLECKGERRFSNPSNAKLHSMTNKCLIFSDQGLAESKILTLCCITEQRDALRKLIGRTFVGMPFVGGDVLLQIVRSLVHNHGQEYGYDDALWPSIELWIQREFVRYFQNLRQP